MTTLEMQRTKDEIEEQIEEWIQRLNTLFSTLEDWCKRITDTYEIIKAEIPQRVEKYMRDYGVEPKKVPSFTILNGRDRTAFVSSSLWITGADGRVNVTTNKRQFILVDLRESFGQPSKWFIVSKDPNRVHLEFTEEVFHRILRGEEI